MEKIKTMIIDDEILAVNFLKKIINWEEVGFEIIGSAANAEAGLQLFKMHPADLVITDICMPGRNGLELCSDIKNINPDVKIIILTAYKNFDYAKCAIEVGVVDYLVKHEITQDILRGKLAKIKDSFQDAKKMVQINEREELKHLILGELTDRRIRKALSDSLNKEHRNFIMYISFYKKFESISTEMHRGKVRDMFEYIAEIHLNERILILLLSMSDALSRLQKNKLSEYAAEIFDEEAADTRILVTVVPQDIEELEGAYKRCVTYETYMRYFHVSEKIMEIGDAEKNVTERKEHYHDFHETVIQICTSLQNGEFYDVEELLKNLYLVRLKEEGAIEDIQLCNRLIAGALAKELQDTLLMKMEDQTEEFEYQLKQCESLQEFYNFFSEKCRFLILLSRKENYNACSAKIKSAAGYILENYMRDIGIGDIASYVGVSESWLVKNFKKEMRKTILDYITEIRIEVAKHELKKADARIHLVAEKTGYKTSQYFSMVFTRKEGITPNQYKNKWKERQMEDGF